MCRIKEWESSQVSKFTEYDTISAMAKLEDAAFKWDQTNYIESTYVKGFEAYLTPYDFKLQVERSFNIKLTGAEVRYLALCHTVYRLYICKNHVKLFHFFVSATLTAGVHN